MYIRNLIVECKTSVPHINVLQMLQWALCKHSCNVLVVLP